MAVRSLIQLGLPAVLFWTSINVYICYVDESGDPGVRGSSHLLLGAAALFEGRWSYLRDDLEVLIARYFPAGPRPGEIHMADLRRGKKEYRALSQDRRNAMIADYCQVVGRLLPTELRFFTVIADKKWWFARNPGKTGDDLYATLFEEISSRFDLFLRRRHAESAPTKGIIVADPHKRDLTNALIKNHNIFQRQGTQWAKVYNLIETVFFLNSRDSPGIQLADLCAYAVNRLMSENDPSIVRQITDVFDREPLNSSINPGKWHGVKYYGEMAAQARIKTIWS